MKQQQCMRLFIAQGDEKDNIYNYNKTNSRLIQDYNSTYTISCVIGVRPVLISNDHRPGVSLDNRTGAP